MSTLIKKLSIVISACALTFSSAAQWINRYNGQGDFSDQFNAIVTDGSGNVYLAGSTIRSGESSDMLVVKLNANGDTVWTATYDGPGNDRDEALAIALDGAGNVYTTGFVKSATGYDFATLKYNAAGVFQWVAYYTYTLDQTDQANSIAVDGSGNVFVCGYSDHDGTSANNDDIVVIKYGALGNQLWATRKDGAASGADRPVKLVLDPAGDPIITGRTFNGSDDDYLTVKYNRNTGTQTWQQIMDRTRNDRATDIAVNASNSYIYVTGRSRDVNYDYVTVCYNAGGTQQWRAVYNSVDDDRATALALDGFGNVYVTGQSDVDATAGFSYNTTTVKYNSAGAQQWAKTYAGAAGNDDIPDAIRVTSAGNCYVAIASDADASANVRNNIITLAYDNAGTVLFTKSMASNNSNDVPTAITEDGSGNIIVAGSSELIPEKNAVVAKYNQVGTEQWTKYYNGQGDNTDNGDDIVVDGSDNVFIAGYSVNYNTNRDLTLQKINAAGTTQWVKSLTGSVSASFDVAHGLAVDASGNVFVGGYTHNIGESKDYTVAKFNQNGDTLWTRTYNSPSANESDRAFGLGLDGAGNVYLSGRSDNDASLASNDDILTVKWDANGNFLWAVRFNGTANGRDAGRAMKVTAAGDVYVAGKTANATNSDYVLIKYNTSGAQQWVKTFDGGADDDATTMAIDNSENIYITGYSVTSNQDTNIVTIKYNVQGQEQWNKSYNSAGNGADKGNGISVDAAGNVTVAGSSDADNLAATLNNDMLCLHYDAAGNLLWAKTHDGSAQGNDEANEPASDANGNVYITGFSENSGTGYDITTIKYSVTGVVDSVYTYNGTGNSADIANRILIKGNDVYTTGSSVGSNNAQRDLLTIKNSVTPLGIATFSPGSIVKAYPNPFTSQTTIDLKGVNRYDNEGMLLKIYDAQGKLLREMKISGELQVEVQKDNLPPGTYLLNLYHKETLHAQTKIIIQ